MSDPVDEQLESFRAGVPEPDDAQRARAFARATAPQRRSRRPALLVVALAVAAVAIAVVVPGHRSASAATILKRVVAATAPAQSGIVHLRYKTVGVPFAGAGKTIRVSVESWRELGGARRFREVSGAIAPPATVELFGGNGSMQLYDPRTNGLYDLDGRSVLPLGPSSTVWALATSSLRDQLESGAVADTWTVTRTTLDGRDVYRIAKRNVGDLFEVRALYVDARTYVPVRLDESGPPKDQPGGPFAQPRKGYAVGKRYPPTVTVTTIETYETLPDGAAPLDAAAVHPDARQLPLSALRPDVAVRVVGSGRSTRPPLPSAPPANVRPLVVDPLAGTIGSFHVGDNLLALSRIVTPGELGTMPVPPGNLRDAAVSGTVNSSGILAVTFGDANEEHSTSAYTTRPFRTTRGDVRGETALADFLARWPEHGATTPSTVVVGHATFYFDAADTLRAVQIGNGDAAHLYG